MIYIYRYWMHLNTYKKYTSLTNPRIFLLKYNNQILQLYPLIANNLHVDVPYMYSSCKQDCLTWAWYVLCLNNTSHCHKWVRCNVIHTFRTDLYMHTVEINSYTRHFSSLVLETLSVRLPPTFSGFPVSRWGLTLSQLHCQELDLVCCPTAEHC